MWMLTLVCDPFFWFGPAATACSRPIFFFFFGREAMRYIVHETGINAIWLLKFRLERGIDVVCRVLKSSSVNAVNVVVLSRHLGNPSLRLSRHQPITRLCSVAVITPDSDNVLLESSGNPGSIPGTTFIFCDFCGQSETSLQIFFFFFFFWEVGYWCRAARFWLRFCRAGRNSALTGSAGSGALTLDLRYDHDDTSLRCRICTAPADGDRTSGQACDSVDQHDACGRLQRACQRLQGRHVSRYCCARLIKTIRKWVATSESRGSRDVNSNCGALNRGVARG
jgi:hypothetical protein